MNADFNITPLFVLFLLFISLSFLDKKAACFAIGGALKAREWTLLKCEIECCNGGQCKDPTLTQDAITVFTPKGKLYILIWWLFANNFRPNAFKFTAFCTLQKKSNSKTVPIKTTLVSWSLYVVVIPRTAINICCKKP